MKKRLKVTEQLNASDKKQKKDKHPIRGNLETRRKYQLEQAEELVQAINHGSSICRGLYLTFLAFTAFLLIIISTTNDYNLLVLTPIKLPIFGAEVDLIGFYRYAPWVYFLAHVNLLMTIALLTRKLAIFHSKLSIQPFAKRELLRAKLHIFAPIQYLSKQQKGVVKFILWIIVKVLLVLMPPFILLLIQIDSLAMQDHTTVWSQRIALLADTLFALFLWKHLLSGRARPLAEVRLPGGKPPTTARQRANVFSTFAVYLFILSLSFLGATIPFSSLEKATAFSIYVSINDKEDINRWFLRGDCDVKNPHTHKNYSKECQNPIKRIFFDGVIEDERKPHEERIVKQSESKCRQALIDLNVKLSEYRVRDIASRKLRTSFCDQLFQIHKEKYDEIAENSRKMASQRCITPISEKPWQPLCWFAGTRWLDNLSKQLPNKVLTANELSADSQNQIRAGALRKLYQQLSLNKPLSISELQEQRHQQSELQGLANQIVGFDLSNRSLNKALLTDIHLPKVIFNETQLNGANLSSMDLNGVKLKKAQLNGADLYSVELRRADLTRAEINGGDLSSAELHDADLYGAELHDADLYGAKLHDVDLRGALLRGVDLGRAELHDADLRRAELHGANLKRAKLHGAILSDTEIYGASLSEAELYGASLNEAELYGVNLKFAKLHGADLSQAELYASDLRTAELDGTYLWRTKLYGVNLSGANFHGADLLETDLRGVLLREAEFTNAFIINASVKSTWENADNFLQRIDKNYSIKDYVKERIQKYASTINQVNGDKQFDFYGPCATFFEERSSGGLISKIEDGCGLENKLIEKPKNIDVLKVQAQILCEYTKPKPHLLKHILLADAISAALGFCEFNDPLVVDWTKDSSNQNKQELAEIYSELEFEEGIDSLSCIAEDRSNPSDKEVRNCTETILELTDKKVQRYLATDR